MNKLLLTLIAIFSLTACFEQPPKTDVSEKTSEKPIESVEKTAMSAEKIKEETLKAEIEKSEAKTAENQDVTSVPELQNASKQAQENSSSDTDKSIANVEVKKSEQADKVSVEQSNAVQEKASEVEKGKNTESKTISKQNVKSTSQTTKSEHRLNAKVVKQDEYNGLSPEELRVGYQKTLSAEEIRYLKRQCRYPFMSDQDVIDFGCGTKKITFAE